MKTNRSLAILGIAASLGFAASAHAQIIVSNNNSPVVLTFDTTVANVVNLEYTALAGVREVDKDWKGMTANAYSMSRTEQDIFGLGFGVASHFVDANNDSDTFDSFSSWSGTGLQLAGNYGMASNYLLLNDAAWAESSSYLRIQNNTGATVTEWTIGFDLYGGESSDTDRTTLHYGYAVSNSLIPGDLLYTNFGSHATTNTGDETVLSFQVAVSETINATVADGDYLVIGLTQTHQNSGSLVGLDNFSVTAGVIPEPTTWALLAGSLTTLMVIHRRRRA